MATITFHYILGKVLYYDNLDEVLHCGCVSCVMALPWPFLTFLSDIQNIYDVLRDIFLWYFYSYTIRILLVFFNFIRCQTFIIYDDFVAADNLHITLTFYDISNDSIITYFSYIMYFHSCCEMFCDVLYYDLIL